MSETTGEKLTEQLTMFDDNHSDLGDGERLCNKCNLLLPLSSFSAHSGGNYLRPECKKCNNELSKVRNYLRSLHPEPTENYICPICLGSEDDVRGKGNTRNGSWVLDHCHEKETFRGWLCHKCNRALGGFDDNVDTLKRAMSYLQGELHE